MFQIFKKNIRVFAAAVIALNFTGGYAAAQEITAINFNGDLIGKVIPDGAVVSYDNEIIGNITADSLIVNPQGEIIGGVIPQGVVIGNDNKLMGRVNNDGSVRLPSGKIIGKVLPNGLVVNDTYDILGSVLFPGLVYNDAGQIVGRLAGDGTYINLEGHNIGFISPNGYAYRNNGVEYILDGRLISSKMVVSSDGNFIGSVVPGGKVTDFDANEIGSIHANGYAYNKDQKIIGKIVNSGYAFDNSGNYLGFVSYNGEVVQNGDVVGLLRSDEKIVNDKNKVIGFRLDLAATASDLNGKYLGRLNPQGKIVRAQEQVGTVGARGQVFDKDGAVIGQIVMTGPVFDYLGNITAQALRNSVVTSLNGTPLGYQKGQISYDNVGRILGAVHGSVIAVNAGNNIIGVNGIGSELNIGADRYKISPFGYVFSQDNILSGYTIDLTALYREDGSVSAYVGPDGTLQGIPAENPRRLTQFGQMITPDNTVEAFGITPYFAVSENGHDLGTLDQVNHVLDQNKKIQGTIVPEYKIIKTDDFGYMPVDGAAGVSRIAIGVNGNMLGYADILGVVRDYSNNIVGKVLTENLVANSQNSVIGQLMPMNGVVNQECGFIGVLDARGKIRNSRDVILGSLLPNKQVISEVGNVIGHQTQGGIVIDFQGKEIGTATAMGSVLNYNNENLGCLRWNGRLYNSEGKFTGNVVYPAPVMDFENQISGRILLNGRIADNQGKLEGSLQPDDSVVDNEQQTVGMAFRYRFAFDNDNIFMGRINEKGDVVDDKNDVLGHVSYNGSVVADKKEVGYALYDFYMYNEQGQAIGYLLGDGSVTGFAGGRLGKMDKGFLVDQNYNLIGRGLRDYIVRDKNHKALGELSFNGDLISYDGAVLGHINNGGEVLDSDEKVVANAYPLQYYNIVKPEPKKPADWVEPAPQIRIEPVTPSGEDNQEGNDKAFSLKAIGIALTPDGNYLGDILANNDVIDKLGNLIGSKMPDGLIIDNDGNLMGIEEVKNVPNNQMFIPAGTFGPGSAYGTGNTPTNLGPGGGFGPGERYDSARSAALAAAQSARRSEIAVGQLTSNIKREDFDGRQDNWDDATFRLSSWRVDMSEMILADKPIPAVLARTLMSGTDSVPATAIVERNVYAEDGRNIVIPAGSRIIGDGNIAGGGGGESSVSRVQITWKRLIRPDGSAFSFSSAQTGDAQGRGGALAYVDEQLLKKYTAPIVTSFLSSAIAYFTATDETTENGGENGTENSKQQAANDARQNFLTNMDAIFQDIMQRKSQIQAAVYVPAGTRLIIYPMEDLWIRTIERAQNLEERLKGEKPRVLIAEDDVSNKEQRGGSSGGSSSSSGSTSGVVYEDEDVNAQPATPLIDSPKPKKKSATAVGGGIPPVTTTGATPPPPSTNVTGGTSGATPQLF